MSFAFEKISHAYGTQNVLDDISLIAQPGDITCLFGPSGCGKTTLLRLAAGLMPVQSGQITLDGQLLCDRRNNPSPENRPVGLVFQEGALFPHMTVAENIGFGVQDRQRRPEVVRMLIEQIGLTGREETYPDALSGGQQQRVALARALAPEPQVILLDEPFASIDVVFRRALREETRRILKARNAVAILVTHDPDEAVEIGDSIAVMAGGQIAQHAQPTDLYDQPATAEVAELFGRGQRIVAHRTADGIQTPWGLWPETSLRDHTAKASDLTLIVRPGDLDVSDDGSGDPIEDVRVLINHQRVSVARPDGERLIAHVPRNAPAVVGTKVKLLPKPRTVFAFGQS
ncbi:MAG: ABC transporter ATP-binding protein [Pseudomonadota bacterium]